MWRSWLILGVSSCFAARAQAPGVRLSILEQRDTPVIQRGDAGTEGNKYGFEGGCVLKLGGVYHMFASEMMGDPRWVKMRLAHWTSGDRLHWRRQGTMYESSGERTGQDPRASLWAPMPVFDEQANRWNLFYVAYRAPAGAEGWHGRIWRAVSRAAGREGIDGPWEDAGVVMEPGPASEAWEGNQGTDSFFAYRVGRGWAGFYGSSDAKSYWSVGLAESPELKGPWKRRSAANPVTLSGGLGTENPVVTRLRTGRYVAVFDTIRVPDMIGYADSADGLHWSHAGQMRLRRTPALWVKDVRTPLGLVEEPDGTFTLFYTGYDKPFGEVGYGSVGLLRVKVE